MTMLPHIAAIGTEGYLVRFADRLDDAANRALVGFAAALEAEDIVGVVEVSTALASVFVRFDVTRIARADLVEKLQALLDSRDWTAERDNANARLWRVPTLYGGAAGPQLGEVAKLVGVTEEAAVRELSAARVRVLAIGFAPGQPYLGMLPERWDVPRQTALSPRVPQGALVLAVRQFNLFANETPTGWRHIATTHLKLFQPDAPQPFVLRPGDELLFPAVSEHDWALLETDPMGGAQLEEAT
ncbi:5-oxoprolinase subunit B family protein [Lentibacter sp.]|uniref:5-oxoprolinase subunit B family protein n=1 Tax=Lentibacter sp. TaxID=2024994 RepID=UPI003F6A2D90